MASKPAVDIEQAFIKGTPIDEALNEAVQEAVRQHKQAGQPLAVWRDGRTVWVSAEEIETAAKDDGLDDNPNSRD